MVVKSKTLDEDKDYWATPDDIYRGALAYFKSKSLIDPDAEYVLDACASEHNTKHEHYFDEKMNSLDQQWVNFNHPNFHRFSLTAVWCNPPYSRGSKEKFIAKAIEQANRNYVPIIMLLPNDTSAEWFSDCVKHATAIAFICNGRINFIHNQTGKVVHGNSAGSILVLFAPRKQTKVAMTLYVTRDKLKKLGAVNNE